MAKNKKLADYLREMDSKIKSLTVRAPDHLWARVDKLAEKHGESKNLVIIKALEKVLDDEGIPG